MGNYRFFRCPDLPEVPLVDTNGREVLPESYCIAKSETTTIWVLGDWRLTFNWGDSNQRSMPHIDLFNTKTKETISPWHSDFSGKVTQLLAEEEKRRDY